MEECEDLAKQLIGKHAIIQILLAFPKCSFEVGPLERIYE